MTSDINPYDPFILWLIPVAVALVCVGLFYLGRWLFQLAWKAGGKGEE